MKNILVKIGSLMLIAFLLFTTNSIYANDVDTANVSIEDIEKYLEEETNIDTTNLDLAEIAIMYDELTDEYTNEDIANIIEENKEEIMKEVDIDEKSLDAGTTALRSLDTEETKKILKEDLNIEEMQQKLDSGYSINEVVQEMQEQLTTWDKISIAFKLLLASSIVKILLTTLAFFCLYKIIIRWLMFRKAGKHGWASIIPIYSEITYLNVINISPWWILILLIPIFRLANLHNCKNNF